MPIFPGTNGPDVSPPGFDVLYGLDGNDRLFASVPLAPGYIEGGRGDDYLFILAGVASGQVYGGEGADTLLGNTNPETLYGGDGDDFLAGTAPIIIGNDPVNPGAPDGASFLDGGNGTDALYGFEGADTILGGEGDDSGALITVAGPNTNIGETLTVRSGLFGGGGADIIDGGGGDDSIDGGADGDTLLGGLGNDTILGGAAQDRILGGDGEDSIDGGDAGDYLAGEAGNDAIAGGAGDDYLAGDVGNDTLNGGLGLDTLDGGVGDDTLSGQEEDDWLFGGDNNDTLMGGDGADYLFGGSGDNALYGEAGADSLIDGDGNGYLLGGADDDTMFGGGGNDTMTGGTGDDYFEVTETGDVVVEQPGEGTNDRIWAYVDYTLPGNVEHLILRGAAAVNGVGNSGDNVIRGNDIDNFLYGAGGHEVMFGGKGNDFYEVDSSDDQVVELPGEGFNDRIWSSADYVLPVNVESLTLIGSAESGTGNAEGNVIRGNAIANRITGAGGDDLLFGEAGGDTFVFGLNFGHDVLADFQGGAGPSDTLEFSKSFFANEAGFRAASHQIGADVVVVFNAANHIVIANTTIAQIHTDDLLFV
jgi:Ca2+-binding RTX toxin-like protein